MSRSDFVSPNARRWLNLISFAEGTWGRSGPRYDITFGYTPINDLSKHPDRVVRSGGYASAAAGAYQFMPSTWQRAAAATRVSDFGPRSQDLAALQLMRWRGVDPDRAAISPQNIAKLSGEWAAFPTLRGGSAYGQPSKSFQTLLKFAQSQGAAPVSYDPSARYATGGPETGSADSEIDQALAQTILGGYIGSILSKTKGDASLAQSTMPDVPHSTYDETDEEIDDKFLQTLVETEDQRQISKQKIEDQALRQGELEIDRARQKMNQLIANAQQAFKPASAVF